jgi:hypothetical protein
MPGSGGKFYIGMKETGDMRKYIMAEDDCAFISGRKLKRIISCQNFSSVLAGEKGGYLESEENLSHEGGAWVHDAACVFEEARVFGEAKIFGEVWIRGEAKIFGGANIFDGACVREKARVFGKALVFGEPEISGEALVFGEAEIHDSARLCGKALVRSVGDLIYSRGLGENAISATAFKTAGNGICVCSENFYGTLEDFLLEIKTKKDVSKALLSDVLCFAQMVKSHFKSLRL